MLATDEHRSTRMVFAVREGTGAPLASVEFEAIKSHDEKSRGGAWRTRTRQRTKEHLQVQAGPEKCLETLSEAHERYATITHAYCLMTNHDHLLIETRNANLPQIETHLYCII